MCILHALEDVLRGGDGVVAPRIGPADKVAASGESGRGWDVHDKPTFGKQAKEDLGGCRG